MARQCDDIDNALSCHY